MDAACVRGTHTFYFGCVDLGRGFAVRRNDDEDFDNWCADNGRSMDDEDAWDDYQDYLAWWNDRYLYNGLRKQDFL